MYRIKNMQHLFTMKRLPVTRESYTNDPEFW